MTKYEISQGIYQFNGLVNGRSSWIKGDLAIWFVEYGTEWRLGNLDDIGSRTTSIFKTATRQDKSIFLVDQHAWYWSDLENDFGKIPSGDMSINCFTGMHIISKPFYDKK